MAELKHNVGCLTCFQPSGLNLLNVQSADALRKHFWFTEADLQQAIICQFCWEQIRSFHQFYISVEELYQSQSSYGIDIKPEPETDGVDCVDEVRPECSSIKGNVETGQLENLNSARENKDIVLSDQGYDGLIEDKHSSIQSDDEDTLSADEPSLVKSNGDPNALKNPIAKQRRVEKIHPDDERIKWHVKYICDQCGHEAETFRHFKEHALEQHHIKSPALVCCGRKHKTRYSLLRHVQLLKNPDKFRCEDCEKSFKSKAALRCHNDLFHASGTGDRIFKCDLCQKAFAVHRLFREHMETHAGRWKCEACDKNFQKCSRLRSHGAQMHPELPLLPCNECPQGFSMKVLLLQHKKMHHEQQQCLICLQTLPNGNTVRSHTRKTHPEAMFCYTCMKVLPTAEDLQAHKNRTQRSRRVHDVRKYQSLDIDDNDREVFSDESQDGSLDGENEELSVDGPGKHSDMDADQLLSSVVVKEERILQDPDEIIDQHHADNKESKHFQSGYPAENSLHDRVLELPSRDAVDAPKTQHHSNSTDFCPEETLPKWSHEEQKVELLQNQLVSISVKSEPRDGEDDLPECSYDKSVATEQMQEPKNDTDSEHTAPEEEGQCLNEDTTILDQQQMDDEIIKKHVLYKCEHCGKECRNFSIFKRHVKRVHGVPIFVRCCGKKFDRKDRLLEHVQLINNPDFFRCQECPKKLNSTQALKRHIKIHHAFQDGEIYCGFCQKRFYDEDAYKQHVKNHLSSGGTIEKC